MNLSDHFTLDEMIKSQTALRRGILNNPEPAAVANLIRLSKDILEPVREEFGPFSPTSGYRSPALNAAVGSKPTSQHVKGEAVDFEIAGIANFDLAVWVRDNLAFDQLILEFYEPGRPSSGWVHVSLKDGENRMRVLTINRKGVFPGLLK